MVGGEPGVNEKENSKSIENLSKHQLEELLKKLSKIKKKKYARNKDRKYGKLMLSQGIQRSES